MEPEGWGGYIEHCVYWVEKLGKERRKNRKEARDKEREKEQITKKKEEQRDLDPEP